MAVPGDAYNASTRNHGAVRTRVSMPEITCYLIDHESDAGDYKLELPEDVAGQAVRLVCEEDVRVSRSAAGELLLYRGRGGFGISPQTAIRSGWCRVVTEDE